MENFADFPVKTVIKYLQTPATCNDTFGQLMLVPDVMLALNVARLLQPQAV
jgi:hypothetical protein